MFKPIVLLPVVIALAASSGVAMASAANVPVGAQAEASLAAMLRGSRMPCRTSSTLLSIGHSGENVLAVCIGDDRPISGKAQRPEAGLAINMSPQLGASTEPVGRPGGTSALATREPASLALAGLALIGLGVTVRRRQGQDDGERGPDTLGR